MPKPLERVMKPIFVEYTMKDSERLDCKKDEYGGVWNGVLKGARSKKREGLHREFLKKVYELETGPQSFDKESETFISRNLSFPPDSRYDKKYPLKEPIGQPLVLPDDFKEMVKETVNTYIKLKNEELPEKEKLTPEKLSKENAEDLLVKFHELARLFIKPADKRVEGRERALNLAMLPVLRPYSNGNKCDIFAFLYTALCRAAGINAKTVWSVSNIDHLESHVFSPQNGWIKVDWPGGIREKEELKGSRLHEISEDTRRIAHYH